jgi:hypothetical protein
MGITGQAVELGNDQFGAEQPAKLEPLGQLRTVGLLAALNFDKLFCELPIAAIQEVLDRLALRFQAKAGFALARRRNPQTLPKASPAISALCSPNHSFAGLVISAFSMYAILTPAALSPALIANLDRRIASILSACAAFRGFIAHPTALGRA